MVDIKQVLPVANEKAAEILADSPGAGIHFCAFRRDTVHEEPRAASCPTLLTARVGQVAKPAAGCQTRLPALLPTPHSGIGNRAHSSTMHAGFVGLSLSFPLTAILSLLAPGRAKGTHPPSTQTAAAAAPLSLPLYASAYSR